MKRYLELRRHSRRIRPNEHLSQRGVALARRIGAEMGPYDWVVTSSSPRAIETAVAMGFAVDEEYEPVCLTEAEQARLGVLLPEGMPFVERARVMGADDLAARFARALAAQWSSFARRLRPDGRELVISHGGYLDDSAVACLPGAPHQEWGGNFGHCEGILLTFEGGRFTAGQILRV
jgi:broad specificity phosphatase PhoE